MYIRNYILNHPFVVNSTTQKKILICLISSIEPSNKFELYYCQPTTFRNILRLENFWARKSPF